MSGGNHAAELQKSKVGTWTVLREHGVPEFQMSKSEVAPGMSGHAAEQALVLGL